MSAIYLAKCKQISQNYAQKWSLQLILGIGEVCLYVTKHRIFQTVTFEVWHFQNMHKKFELVLLLLYDKS